MDNSMISFEDFAVALRESVADKLGESSSVVLSSVIKNNGVEKHALVIRENGSNIAKQVYIDDMYTQLQYLLFEKDPISYMANNVMDSMKNAVVEINPEMFNFNGITDKIYFTLINRKKNETLLKSVPFIPYLDLAIVFRILVDNGKGTESISSALITNSIQQHLELLTPELYEHAKRNTPVLFPVKYASMTGMLHDMNMNFFGEDEEIHDTKHDPLCVLTNTKSVGGAAALLYPGILKKIADDIGQDFYILPSSIHEVIILKNLAANPKDLAEMIKGINGSELIPEDVLSDSPYIYDSETDEVRMM